MPHSIFGAAASQQTYCPRRPSHLVTSRRVRPRHFGPTPHGCRVTCSTWCQFSPNACNALCDVITFAPSMHDSSIYVLRRRPEAPWLHLAVAPRADLRQNRPPERILDLDLIGVHFAWGSQLHAAPRTPCVLRHALLGAHACGMMLRACNPMRCLLNPRGSGTVQRPDHRGGAGVAPGALGIVDVRRHSRER